MQATTKSVSAALFAIGLLLPLLTSPSHAIPVCDAATGHCYDTNVSQGLPADTWAGAEAAAATVVFNGQPGHLVTITSLAENLFILQTFGAFPDLRPWMGLRQVGQTVEPGSCTQGPAGGWTWVTGEPFYSGPSSCVFENWGLFPTEPNDESGIEHCAHLDGPRGPDSQGHQWNDIVCDNLADFIIEWDVPQGACLAPPAGMTGWWPGDGNTDDIVGARNAVLRGDADTRPGLVGDAFVLDGDGDFVEVPHDPALNVGTGDFTVDLWAFFNDTAGEQVLAEKWIQRFPCTPCEGWTFTKLEGNILHMALFSGDGSGELVFSEVLTIPLGTWHHFAARRQSGAITLFMNGAPVASGAFSGNLDSTSSLKFGHRGSPSDTPGSEDERGFFLNGRIDEVELFVGRTLSDTEIQAIFAAGSAGKCKIVNDFVTFEPIPSTYQFTTDITGCPAEFVGIFNFDATLTNISDRSLALLAAQVTTLTNGNLLLNADRGPGGVGAQLIVPRREGFTDGVLSAEESVDVPFAICLQEQSPFRFFVDVLGVISTPAIQTQVLLSYLSPGYRFLVVPFGEGVGFEQPDFDDAHFEVGDAAFGTGGSCPLDSTVQTPWPLETDLLLRKTFLVPAHASTVQVAVAIDNDVQVFMNGQDISGGLQVHEECAERESFVFSVPESLLVFGGENLLAVRARDRGIISYVDVEIRADIPPF
jgi:hypothetical protein